MNPTFSLILATRERVPLLKGLLESIEETTYDKVEIIIIYDNDDLSIKKVILEYSDIKFVGRERSEFLNKDYINFAASLSHGKYIFVLNDDVIFQTKNWDKNALEILERTDNICYGLVGDGMDEIRKNQKLEYTGFPILGRAGVEILSYAMHPGYKGWGADIHLYNLYNSIGRVIDLRKQVSLLHLSPHNGMRSQDEINKHVSKISFGAVEQSIEEDKEKLLQGMDKAFLRRKNALKKSI